MKEAERLAQFKKRHGLSYSDMAKLMNLPIRTIFRWIHDEHKPSPMGERAIRELIDSIEGKP